MDDKNLELLMENDREWRRFMIDRVEKLGERMTSTEKWNFLFQVVGSAFFSVAMLLLAVWVEWKINPN